jgi:O-antigen ligase
MNLWYLLIALAVGSIAPFLTGSLQFFFALVAVFLAVILFSLRKGKITTYDCIMLFICLIPFHHFRIGGEDTFIRLTELAAIPLLILWAARSSLYAPFSRKRIPLEYFILCLFFALTLLSITKSLYPHISLYRTAVLLYLVVFSFVIADSLDTEKKISGALKMLSVVAGLSGIWGVLQMFLPQLSFFYSVSTPVSTIAGIQIFRASGGWNNPNYFALFLSLVIPLTYIFAYTPGHASRLLQYCLFFQLLGLLTSYSRNGMISTVAAMVFLFWFLRKKKAVLIILLIVVIVIGGIWIGREWVSDNMPYVYAVFLRAPLYQVEQTPASVLIFRWDAWQANLGMFLDNPLLGVGPFMSGENFLRYRPPKTAYPLDKLEPHNEYISMLSERGIFGFLLFIIFLAMLTRRGINAYEKSNGSFAGLIILGVTAGIISFVVAGLAEAVLTDNTFWLLVGVLFAAERIIDQQAKKNMQPDSKS